ncbi:hypothetical protein [uncultured Desulfobacter sp.]|uniref:hypothetical protein n=1 Tax=uncultured Desulfobacter sp. TaxID=240139 RepID=UPI0029F5A6D7|nr:hypothetical protein [uncultured Desulfobacter sp.]
MFSGQTQMFGKGKIADVMGKLGFSSVKMLISGGPAIQPQPLPDRAGPSRTEPDRAGPSRTDKGTVIR